jgi:hypothetical protein
MRGLSFSQPWLWAVQHAGKDIENRDWPPPIEMIGKQIALHAAKSFDDGGVHSLAQLGIADRPDTYEKSAIVAVATIDRVVTETKSLTASQRRWFFGKYGWILTDVITLGKSIPWDGALGLWIVPPIVEGLIRRQLAGEYIPKYLPPFTAALAAAGVETATEWATKNPGQHLWFEYDNLPSCAACGLVKPHATAKKPPKPCKGVVGLSLRGTHA